MLDLTRLTTALTAKRADFGDYDRQARSSRKRYHDAWRQLQRLSREALAERLDGEAVPAWPSVEWDPVQGAVVGGGCVFTSHEEAHGWAAEQLQGCLTLGADASQIEPQPDLMLPVALVQVAWFLNPHTPAGDYRKDAELHLLSPADLTEGAIEAKAELVCSRFEQETGTLARLLREETGRQERAVAFYDGPLAISFADRAPPETQRRYVAAMRELLAASEASGIPVVGYIDSSQARDLAGLVAAFGGQDPDGAPADAALIGEDLAGWGQRTAAFACRRPGVWQEAGSIGFAYLRTHGALPSRIEFPWWVVERGLLPQVVQTVLAECVIGQGFPYPLEVADATAVLSSADRNRFLRVLEAFAAAEGFALNRSHKVMSKGRRR